MRIPSYIIFIILTLQVFLCLPNCSIDNPVDSNPPVMESLSDIQTFMDYYHIPGISIAIIDDFKIDTLIALGVKDNETHEPMTTETLLMAGSISKPVA